MSFGHTAPSHHKPTPPLKSGRICLVDADCFFAACAKLASPDLRHEDYVIVGGGPRGGVVTSATYPVRRFGVHAGMPVHKALGLCPRAKIVGVPSEMIAKKHMEIFRALTDFSPAVLAASIDEFFVDLSGTELLYKGESLDATLRRMKQHVLDVSGVSVSIGAGTQPTVAKMAASLAKPGGIRTVPAGEEMTFMLEFDLADIPFVGRVLSETLARRGIVTTRDLLALDEATLTNWLGKARGEFIYQRVRGIDPTQLENSGPSKSIGRGTTFEDDLWTDESLEEELMRLVVEVADTMRREGRSTRHVSMSIRDLDFKDRGISKTLPHPVISDRVLFTVARDLMNELRERKRGGVRAMRFAVSRLNEWDRSVPLPLFPELADPTEESEKDRAVSRALDKVRSKFGLDAITPALALAQHKELSYTRDGLPKGGAVPRVSRNPFSGER